MENKDIKKWTKALRSGEYKQTKGTLQDSRGFCCLGVACDIFIPKGDQVVNRRKWIAGNVPASFQMFAPDWLKTINMDFSEITGKAVAELNDADKMTFNEIADVLEAVYILKVLD